MNAKESAKYIRKTLPTLEILCQLAEEAADLSQAALELRRSLDGTNPTPVPPRTALASLLEEYADVNLCGNLLFSLKDFCRIKEIRGEKLTRWAERLKEDRDEG